MILTVAQFYNNCVHWLGNKKFNIINMHGATMKITLTFFYFLISTNLMH